MKYKRKSDSPLTRKARRGFRGYPAATVLFYGPDDKRASKIAVGIVAAEGAEPVMHRWYSDDSDVRYDPAIRAELLQLIQHSAVKTVVMISDNISGCPHEEGIDYPDGEVCPQCPFWAHRDRWTGEIIH
jgi:hypothetical protein